MSAVAVSLFLLPSYCPTFSALAVRKDFLQVVAAFEILSDPKRRREHDQQLEQPGNLKVQSKRSRPAGRTVPEKGTQEAPKQRKEEKAPDKEPPAGDDPDTTMPQAPSAQAACGLLRELLLLSQKDLLLRLKQMSEEDGALHNARQVAGTRYNPAYH